MSIKELNCWMWPLAIAAVIVAVVYSISYPVIKRNRDSAEKVPRPNFLAGWENKGDGIWVYSDKSSNTWIRNERTGELKFIGNGGAVTNCTGMGDISYSSDGVLVFQKDEWAKVYKFYDANNIHYVAISYNGSVALGR